MGGLAYRSAHTRPSARPPIDMSSNFLVQVSWGVALLVAGIYNEIQKDIISSKRNLKISPGGQMAGGGTQFLGWNPFFCE